MFEEAEEFNNSALKEYESLIKEEKLKWFSAVVQKIVEAEVKTASTYRKVLYDHFGFDESSYTIAQFAGFLSLHNLIVGGKEFEEIESFDSLIVFVKGRKYVFEPSCDGLQPNIVYKSRESNDLVVKID